MLTTSCHCGAVRLEIARPPRTLTQCNCSICRRYGAIWSYHRRKSVKLFGAQKARRAYTWRGVREFYHCRRCGCVTHYEHVRKKKDGSDTLAVNIRNVDQPEVVAPLPIRMLDGASTWTDLDRRPWPDLFRSPTSATRRAGPRVGR